MTRRLLDVALADEILAELARQHRTRADLATSSGVHERTLRRKLNGSSELRVAELEAIAGALDVEVGTLHSRARAALEAAMRRHPAGSAVAS